MNDKKNANPGDLIRIKRRNAQAESATGVLFMCIACAESAGFTFLITWSAATHAIRTSNSTVSDMISHDRGKIICHT